MALPKINRQPSPEFKCETCKRQFTTKQALRGHERIVHGVQVQPQPNIDEIIARLETTIRETGAQMAQAIGDPNPVYTDPEAGKAEGYRDAVAPPTFGTCVGLWGGPGFPDLCEKLGTNPVKMLHAEHEYQYLGPIYPGDTLHATIELADTYTKEGRSGRMQFYVLETTCTNQSGEMVLISRATLMERI